MMMVVGIIQCLLIIGYFAALIRVVYLIYGGG